MPSGAIDTHMRMPPELEATVVRLCEGGTLLTAATLLEAGRSALRSGGALVVECAEVDFLDSALLQVLIALRRAALVQGGSVRVIGISETITRYLNLAGLIEAVLGPDDQGRGGDHGAATEATGSGSIR